MKKKLGLALNSKTFEWELIDTVLEHGFDLIVPVRTQHIESELTITSANVNFVPKVLPFTQGTPTKQMYERGLGRSSTYAKIVQNLLERGYVVQKGD